jgi:hypothetical protein
VHYSRGHQSLGHSIVSQHFIEPECPIPNSQELSTCPYPEPDQSSPHHRIPPLQEPSYYPPTYVLVFIAASFPLAFPLLTYARSSSPLFVLVDDGQIYKPSDSEENKCLTQITKPVTSSSFYIPDTLVCWLVTVPTRWWQWLPLHCSIQTEHGLERDRALCNGYRAGSNRAVKLAAHILGTRGICHYSPIRLHDMPLN